MGFIKCCGARHPKYRGTVLLGGVIIAIAPYKKRHVRLTTAAIEIK
ncbi:MAG: hypothetical protein QNJ26_00985 [Desulfobacterales bacterium]|nr:hypothetical protein [Desulfobacterales bacterium]